MTVHSNASEVRSADGYAGDVTPDVAHDWMQSGVAVMVDVRTDAEREWVGFVPGAVAVAVLGAVSRDHAALPPEVRTVDPPNPDAAPRMVLPSFEDATRATSAQQPNARKGDK